MTLFGGNIKVVEIALSTWQKAIIEFGKMPDNDVLTVLVERQEAIKNWLDQQAPYTDVEQKHLDDASAERAYWHHGYQTACADILLLICSEHPTIKN